MIKLLSSLALAASVAAGATTPAELRREALMAELGKGGYTILLRHARTDRSFNEARDYVPKERSAQRNLTDDGVRDARLMGVVLKKYRIPIGEIIASPMFRTVETAEMAAGKPTTTMALRVFPSTPEQAALVATPPKPGTNRLLVTHHFVIEAHVPGVSPGAVGESEAAVVRHTPDGKVELVGLITLADWETLAGVEGTTSNDGGMAGHGAAPAAGPGAAPAGGHAAAPAGEGTGIALVPDTHAGHVARKYLSAFNSGDAATMRAWIESWAVPDPARPTEERLKSYAKLFDEHGPLSVVSAPKAESLEVVLSVRSKRGSLQLIVKSSEAQPMRASSVTFMIAEGSHR